MTSNKITGIALSNKPLLAKAITLLILLSTYPQAQADQEGSIGLQGFISLKTVPVPEPANLAEFVRNKTAAIQLGKALFWDMQVGSDGIQACASCHFSAGTDTRTKNQLGPSTKNGTVAELNQAFNPTASGSMGGPNYTLTKADFPFHQLSNPSDPNSTVLFDTDDVVSSQGVAKRNFVNLAQGGPAEVCQHQVDAVFKVNGSNVRRVQSLNSPSVINAVFNFRNFWDGRASNDFNGVNSSGKNDPNARIFTSVNGKLQQTAISISSASLASQAVDPPLNNGEMSCANRPFAILGKKLLDKSLVPLGRQAVHPNDSVLGIIANQKSANKSGKGLRVSYEQLIKQAFLPVYWDSQQKVTLGNEQFSQMSANFSLFFGLAIQLYQATLVSDNAPIDRFAEGKLTALTQQQQQGLAIFQTSGACTLCHQGALLTEAPLGTNELPNIGFINIGVRPDAEDSGNVLTGGAKFKTPSLRNVELTGPYFHNGGQATLRQVMDFYVRGGDFDGPNKSHSMFPVDLDIDEEDAVIAFLLALTDDRVRWERAPFDHPQLFITNGHQGDQLTVIDNGFGRARDSWITLPAVGANGATKPLRPFLNLSPFQP